mmetsp:Transcript_35675/g.100981  ORF Transcript_35675/g.100981 Transcript_35675/m.100981 type:complete len:371 (-) Transcript_35675:166-1278(-)
MVYFVVEGECRLRRSGGSRKDTVDSKEKPAGTTETRFYDANTVARLGPGDFFGEASAFPEVKHDGWYVEAHSDCKLYSITAPELLNSCTRDIVDIVHKAALFKLEYYENRITSMEEKRRNPGSSRLSSMKLGSISRKTRDARPSEAMADDATTPQSPSPAAARASFSLRSLRSARAREELDEDEQELGLLDELKQHILESALELEEHRLEMYHRPSPSSPKALRAHSSMVSTDNQAFPPIVGRNPSYTSGGSAASRQVSLRSSHATPEAAMAATARTSVAAHYAYPRSPDVEFMSPKEALAAAGGLKTTPAISGSTVNLSGRHAVPDEARGARGSVNNSGYMQIGGRGYIGYDANHMKAQVARRSKLQSS